MSQRGLILALQRIHDDPGFVDLVSQDPQSTLGIYDLDETEYQALTQAITNRDGATIRRMAGDVGINWTAAQLYGVGALPDEEASIEPAPGTVISGPADMAYGGYERVTSDKPIRPA
jgi:hypothetical protein